MSSPQVEKPLWELNRGRNFSRQNALPPKGSCGFSKSRLVDARGGSLVTVTGSLCQAAAWRSWAQRDYREMGTRLSKEKPALSKMRAAALRLQQEGNMLSPGAAGGEQVCELMGFSSRRVWKEEAIFSFLLLEGSLRSTLRPLALPYLSDNNTSPVPGLAEDRRERSQSLHGCFGSTRAL